MHDQQDDGHDQDQVEQAGGDVKSQQAEQPADNENTSDNREHGNASQASG
jgi:hypothetical protein